MKEFLYMIVGWIAEIHSYLMRFNDSYEYNFSEGGVNDASVETIKKDS